MPKQVGDPGHDPTSVPSGAPETQGLRSAPTGACPADHAARSAARTALRSSMARVIGPDPAEPGGDPPGHLGHRSSTSERSFLPSQEVPAPTTAAPGLTMSGCDQPGPAGRGHHHVGRADQAGQVLDPGVHDGHRGVAARAASGPAAGPAAGRWSGPGR